MKGKFTHIYAILAVLFLVYSFSSSPQTGLTGAPGESNCTNCHGDTNNFEGNVQITGLPAMISPSTTYTITVTTNVTSGNANRAGFSMVVLDGSNTNAGNMTNNLGNTSYKTGGGRTYFGHAPSQSFNGGNTVSWTTDWTSPAGPIGETITMYTNSIIGGGSGSGGDEMVHGEAMGTIQAGGGALGVSITNVMDVSCLGGNDGSATAEGTGGSGNYSYNWSSGDMTATATNLTADMYTVTVTDMSNGATETADVDIDQPNSEVMVSIIAQQNIDCNNPVGSATANGNGGTGMISYNWSNGNSGQTTTLNAGPFTVTATDANGCTNTASGTITEDTTAPAADAGMTMQIDCNNAMVTLQGSGSMGAEFSYNWVATNGGNIVNGATTLTPTVDAAGNYTLTVSNNNNGCTSSDMTSVIGDATPPTAEAGPSMQIDCNNMTVTLQGSGSTGGQFSYNWTATNGGNIVSGGNTATPIVNAGGTYTLTVTNNDNGCTNSDVTTVTEDTAAPTANAGPSMTLSCTSTIVTLDGTASTQGMNYAWTTVDGNIVNGANSQTPTVDSPGTYDLVVTNPNNGCSSTVSSVVVADDTVAPIANAGSDMELSCTVATVTLDGTGSSGSNLSYNWSTINGNIVSGGNTATPTVNASGLYTLTVTNNDNGCTDTDDVTVTENASAPIADAGSSMTLTCAVTSVTLNGSGSSQGANFSYQWTTINGNIVSGANTLMPEVDAAGQYCIEVTDLNNGCTSMACVIVNEDTQAPIVNIAPPNELDCLNACIMLDGTGSSQGAQFLYQWTGPNIVSGENTLTPEVCSAGTYELFITDLNNGCTASATVDVTENANIPSLSVNISGNLNCNNSSVVITAMTSASNPSFSWTGPNGFTSNVSNPSVSVAGVYDVIVTDNDNGCTATVQAIVSETTPPTATISSQTNVDCNGQNTGSATVTASGGAGNFSYLWSSGGMMDTETGLTAGMYTVTVTDDDQCTATATVTITEPTALTVNASATAVSSAGANDGTATANPMGGAGSYMYMWSNNMTTQTITDLPPATYTVTVTDANGCTAEESVVVSSFDCDGLTLDFAITNVNCNGGMDGEVTATVTGGVEPITYMWDNGGMMATIANLEAGTYAVTAVDANNCEITGSATVMQPSAISAMATGTNVTCNGGMDGTATATAMGGTGTLTYMWDNGMMGATIMGLSAGTYVVTVTDENNCTSIAMVTITEPAAIMLSVTTADESANGANDGSATANVSGGTGTYTFLWSNGANTQAITNLAPGDYCVTVTDADGCTAEACGFVMMFGCGSVETVVTSTNVSCFGGSDGTASAMSFGGTAPYTYAWSNNVIGETVTGLAAGIYSVTCTDATDCSAVMEVMIGQPDELTISIIDSGDVECEGNETGFASASAMGGILGYSYLWSNADTTSMINDLAPGTYTVTVTDNNMCTAETSVTIEALPDTEMPVVVVNDIMVFLDAAGMVTITPAMIDGGSTDNCGIESIVLDIDEFGCDDLGSNDVVVAVLDMAGLCASATATVMVADSIAPVLTCPANITAQGCNTIVDYDTPMATDNCSTGDPFIMDGLPSGAAFPAGTTTVVWGVNDSFGNPATCSFTVTVMDDFSAMATFTEPACFGFEDGTATATAVNGTPPYTYAWDDADMQMTQTATGLPAGTYTATVTDANGCATVVTVEIGQPEFINIEIVEIIPETNDQMDGAITIEVNGGTGNPFTYEWFLDGNLFSTDPNLTDLDAGTYVLFVTDLSDCTNSDTVIVDMNVGLFENNDEQQITMYPNPTNGEFQLDIQLAVEKEVGVSVFDVTGKTVFENTAQPILNKNLTVDLNDLADGIYLVKVQVGEDVLMRRVLLSKEQTLIISQTI